ncbi:MAG: cell division protein FtsZ [Bryobacteraceae bacterium]|jgi:cell division protein FtsZ
MADTQADNLKYEMEEEAGIGARIKVIGVGGAGCNAVSRLVVAGLGGVEFHAMDTDRQALSACQAPNKLQLGTKITKGLGAGSNWELGRQAALENTDAIVELLQGADMVFVAAGLGGGTGSGAVPVIASLARELEALTVAVVTKPFAFEGPRRLRLAEEALANLASAADTVITIPNERLLRLVPRGASFFEAFKMADDLLRQAVEGVSDIINSTGAINRDFSDIRAVMLGMGYAMMGTAVAKGEGAAIEAARQAISCPLLEDTRIAGARRILINITGSGKLGFHDVNEACAIVRDAAEFEDVQLNFGLILDESMGDSVKVTVIATGVQPAEAVVPERRAVTPVVRVEEPIEEPQPPAPEPPPAAPEPEPEPEPSLIDDADPIDMDDLDTPAYLRQGKLPG